MFRTNVLSGQVYGKVDWVTSDGREFGMFLRTSERDSTRCVMRGPEVERMLANGIVQKGMMATAYGDLSARCLKRHSDGTDMVEVLCGALRVVAESTIEGRLRGSLYANLKGVVMFWDPKTYQLKTFLNPEPGRPEHVTCSVHVKAWLAAMPPESRERFIASLRSGREFTTSARVEASTYVNKGGVRVPTLMLLPTDFKLQG